MELRAGILAIGSEVVEGQIINSNGSWLSLELGDMGLRVLFHLSCPDISVEIKKSMDFLSRHCQLVVTSGGLGPTIDDTTREALSQWAGKSLEFNEDQWEVIENKLKKSGVTLREGHKNQAFIPRGAKPLSNNPGVAPGFFMKTSRCFLASLPGPPSELRPMFEEQLKSLIQGELNPKKEQRLYTWLCFGVAESEIAHRTESVLGKSFEFGFRLFKPYVEIKVRAPVHLSGEQKALFCRLEREIKDSFAGYNLPDIRKKFREKLKVYDCIHVLDYLSFGLFLEKLNETFKSEQIHYQCFGKKSFRYFRKEEIRRFSGQKNFDSQCFLGFFPRTRSSAFVVFNKKVQVLELPGGQSVHSHSGRLFVIESTFLRL